MGITVSLQDEFGIPLEQEALDPHNMLHRLLPPLEDDSFQCLRFVDWYGDTIFNHLQMETLLHELDRVLPAASHTGGKELLEQIRHMAKRCQKEVHLYLKFIGD